MAGSPRHAFSRSLSPMTACGPRASLRDRCRIVLVAAARPFHLVAFMCPGRRARVQREPADLAGIALQRIRIGRQRLKCRQLAPGVRAGGDAVGDRVHPQRVHAVVFRSAVCQEGRFVLPLGANRGVQAGTQCFRTDTVGAFA